MKVYFSASIISGRRLAHLSRRIIEELKDLGHQVITDYMAEKNLVSNERKSLGKNIASIIFKRDMSWLKNDAELVVAEVSTPSFGVGYELSYILEKVDKPVLAIYRKDYKYRVSFFVLGNHNKNLTVVGYNHVNEIRGILEKYFKNKFNK